MITNIKIKPERKKKLNEFLSQKKLKSTKQRDVIFNEFFDNYVGKHITVEDLYEKIKKNNPRIGYATIYRTLKLFKESGIASERNFGDGRARYEPVRYDGDTHHHIICKDCSRIVEFSNNHIESCLKQVAKLNGFSVVNYKIELYGSCPLSKNGRNCEYNENAS